jgi:hypothetical protein
MRSGRRSEPSFVAVVFLVLAWGVRWADGRLPDTDRSVPRP